MTKIPNYLVTIEKLEEKITPTGCVKEQVFKFMITVRGELFKGIVRWTDKEKLTPKSYIRTIVFLDSLDLFEKYGRIDF